MSRDRVVKTIVLKAPLERVWNAITDYRLFGVWFGVVIDGPFVPGKEATGRIEPTQVDAEVARHQEAYKGLPWRARVDCIEPMKRFSFYWHPYAIDPDADYSKEPMTLVTFELQDTDGGILLTVTESGFQLLPADRCEQALKSSGTGWGHVAKLLEKYLALDLKV